MAPFLRRWFGCRIFAPADGLWHRPRVSAPYDHTIKPSDGARTKRAGTRWCDGVMVRGPSFIRFPERGMWVRPAARSPCRVRFRFHCRPIGAPERTAAMCENRPCAVATPQLPNLHCAMTYLPIQWSVFQSNARRARRLSISISCERALPRSALSETAISRTVQSRRGGAL